jgi:glutamine amidotransferase
MCRWLTYMGRPIYLEKLLFEPENSLIRQSLHARRAAVTTNGDGFGVGWYGGREVPGLYREILPAWNDPNLKSLAHQLSSGLFFAHVRASTGTETSRANCHPFAHGRWMFMHNGQIGGYARLRRALDGLLPDHLYQHRRGTTDSEVFFYLLIHHGVDKDPPAAFQKTIARILEIVKEAEVDEPFRMTAILSNGRHVYALRFATDPNPPSLFWRHGDGQLTIVSEPLDFDSLNWNEVAPSRLLVAEGEGEVAVETFRFQV